MKSNAFRQKTTYAVQCKFSKHCKANQLINVNYLRGPGIVTGELQIVFVFELFNQCVHGILRKDEDYFIEEDRHETSTVFKFIHFDIVGTKWNM